MVLSNWIVGDGRRYFREVKRMRLDSPYVPGKRPGVWVKINHYEKATCCILGYTPNQDGTFNSLLLVERGADGEMKNVGSVELGLSHEVRAKLMGALAKLRVGKQRHTVLVEPKLWCQVRGVQRTPAGILRAPTLIGLCTNLERL